VIINARYRIDKIAGSAERGILNHALITEWQDQPVAVAADGFVLAVVPVEMEEGDQPGLVHVSILDHIWPNLEDREFDWPYGDWPISVELGPEQATFKDGWSAPRIVATGGLEYPKWQKVMYDLATDETVVSPGFSVHPSLLQRATDAIGAHTVTIHRTIKSDEQIVLTSIEQDVVEPPFAVLMLAKYPEKAGR
jgi:hypothetical protein